MLLNAHASRVEVKTGQKVRSGERIALVGSTGRATSPHLHFEVEIAGKLYNPIACFSEDQLRPVRVANGLPLAPIGPNRTGRLITGLLSFLH